ncbi:MAG: extracellular solute-binding protein [Fusicatenibacter sp.]
MTRKKQLSMILALIMAASALFSGCGKSESNSGTSANSASAASGSESTEEMETVECLYVVPGDEPKDLEAGLAAINEKMAEDGVGVTLKMQYIPWDAWDQKINIMLSTGEKFDLFQVMNDRVSLANYASRGALADITDEIEQYGENIKKVNPDIMMKSGQVNGVQYAIPAYWVESAIDPEIFVRKDIMEKYGIKEVPTTWDELTEAFETVMNNWDGAEKPYLMLTGSNTSRFAYASKTYDEWPFVVYDRIFYVDQEGNVENFFETEVFKKDCAYASDWYKRGLIDPDCMTVTADQATNQMTTGNYFLGASGDINTLKANYPDISVDDFARVELAPDKPDVRPYGTRNMNAVPLSSEHPEAAVKLVNWIYASQENYDLFMYGREGIDYTKQEPHNREDIIDPATNVPGYHFDDWMMGNVTYLRPSTTCPTEYSDRLYTKNENAVDGYASQFTFDASPVQTEYADVMTVISEYINPMACGVKDYEENIDEALEMLKKAGSDKLIEEFKRQLEESKK